MAYILATLTRATTGAATEAAAAEAMVAVAGKARVAIAVEMVGMAEAVPAVAQQQQSQQ